MSAFIQSNRFKKLHLIFAFCLLLVLSTLIKIFNLSESTYRSRNNVSFLIKSRNNNSQLNNFTTNVGNESFVDISLTIIDGTVTRLDDIEDVKPDTQEKLKALLNCNDEIPRFNVHQQQAFWVLENYVVADRRFKCHESITLTTQGDFTFLDNLVTLLEKWQGPISVTLYAPGDDFQSTLDSIAYLRSCHHNDSLVRQLVTFHLMYDYKHRPKLVNTTVENAYEDNWKNCSVIPFEVNHDEMYKQKHNLTYPINIARNLARKTATTHFVFPSDIELYPSRNFIQKFQKMIVNNPKLTDDSPKVFVLAVFEIAEDQTVPTTKTDLQDMVKAKKAFSFHKRLCQSCHIIPKFKEWMQKPEKETLNVFTTTKRLGSHKDWEPFYVGSNAEPWFDERITWEGQNNKMVQGFIMCLLDYDYMVLDNAFLVHKPGIKKSKEQVKKYQKMVGATHKLLKTDIRPELINIYGKRERCQWLSAPKKTVKKETSKKP